MNDEARMTNDEGVIRCYGYAEKPDKLEIENPRSGSVDAVFIGPGVSYWWLDENFLPQTRYVESAMSRERITVQNTGTVLRKPGTQRPLKFKLLPMPKRMKLEIRGFGEYTLSRF